jgi:hypothetical protein
MGSSGLEHDDRPAWLPTRQARHLHPHGMAINVNHSQNELG